MTDPRKPTRSGLGSAPKAHRRFFVGVLGVFLGVMALFSLTTTTVNPLWVTPAPWTNDQAFKDYRQISRNLRTAKAGLVRSKTWDVAFIGSSRVAMALDPAMPEWGDQRVVNLGLSAGALRESSAMMDYLLDHQKSVRRVFVGVDLVDLTTTTDLAVAAGFNESPLNPASDAVERELRYTTGVSSFIASVKTIRSSRSGKLPPYTDLGHWLRERSNGRVRDILYKDSMPFAVRLIRQRNIRMEIFKAKRDALVHLVNRALERNVELTVLIPPNHAAFLSVFYLDHDRDPVFEMDREAIVSVVAEANAAHPNSKPANVWDFNDFHPLNAEPIPGEADKDRKLFYWADGTHALETLGHVMLKRMMGWPIENPAERDYGREIDTKNLPARLTELRQGFERYRAEHPAEIEWVQSTLTHYSSAGADAHPGSIDAPTPSE